MGSAIITLTTDFGTDSPYVAQMKGVILAINPQATIVDVTHSVAPQDVAGAAHILADVCRRFPAGAIHVVVVDPGVGTDRAIVYAEVGAGRYLAPDNGVLTLVAERDAPSRLIRLAERRYWLEPVSSTFHGRDIFSPVAAHVSLGVGPESLGPNHERLVQLELPRPRVLADRIVGRIVQIDAFGNLITNIESTMLPAGRSRADLRVECQGRTEVGMVSVYAERHAGSLVALIGSGGRLEIAVVDGNASRTLSASVGEEVIVRW
jgi:S-adenosylmethionine hydrolase